MKKLLFSVVLVLALAVTGVVNAGLLIDNLGISIYASGATFNGNSLAIHAVDGSGLVAGAVTANWDDTDLWISANNVADTWMIVDLGDVYNMDSLKIWNLCRPGGWEHYGIDALSLYVSDEAVTMGNPVDNATDYDAVVTATLTEGVPSGSFDTPDDVSLNGISAQYLAFTGTPFWGAKASVGLSEVQFFQVPEPATLLIMGTGLLTLIRRKK